MWAKIVAWRHAGGGGDESRYLVRNQRGSVIRASLTDDSTILPSSVYYEDRRNRGCQTDAGRNYRQGNDSGVYL